MGVGVLRLLTATGTALLLTALAAVVGAVSLANIPGSAERVGDQAGQAGQAAQNPATAETANLGGLPRLPIGGDQLTSGGVVTALLALAAALAGAVLGGLAGMRFHRKVDRVDVEDRT